MKSVSNLLRGTAFFERAAGWKSKRVSYSQFGEDLHILAYYDRLGFTKNIYPSNASCFVDVGCYRPVAQSNSYIFHKQGWHCINIDAAPGSMDIFRRVRPTDTNLEVAIGEQAGEGTFFVFGTPSVWNSFDKAAAAHAQSVLGYAPREIQVPIKPLSEILSENMRGRDFEVLSIDAEGLDIAILKSNDFDRYRPRVILVEVHGISPEAIPQNEVVQFLKAYGYELFSWINPNLMFVRSDSALGEV